VNTDFEEENILRVTCEIWWHFRNRNRFQNGFKI